MEEIKNKEIETCVYGFEDSIQAAKSLMGSIHENLLRGDLVFAYRSSSNKFQIVIVNDLNWEGGNRIKTDKFSISIMTPGYSAYLPHMPLPYLEEIKKDLAEWKAEKKIIEDYCIILDGLKNGGK